MITNKQKCRLLPVAGFFLSLISLVPLRADNYIVPANVSGDWAELSTWGSGKTALPGSGSSYDDVYLRRNNTLTVSSDLSASSNLRYVVVGDGFDATNYGGTGNLIITNGGKLVIGYSHSATALRVSNSGRQ